MLLRNASIVFCNLVNIDTFNNKYGVTVEIDEEQAADAEADGLNVKIKEYEGTSQYQVQFKTKFSPEIKQADGKTPFDMRGEELGRGTKVNVQYSFRPWTSPDKKSSGIASDLNKIQVIALNGGGASEFGDESLGEMEDGDM
jgi:hypothetical protein